MQRDIKFRAWNNVDKRMIEWSTLGLLFHTATINSKYYNVMQFTGWKDAGGVEVYESDIMKGRSKVFGIVVGAVAFSEYIDGEEYIHEKHLGWNVCGIPLIDLINDGCVVDGNIYENPELLGETK